MLNKKHWWQIHTIITNQMKKFSSKITVSVYDVWQLRLFVREFPLAAVLSQNIVSLVEWQIWPLENKKTCKK